MDQLCQKVMFPPGLLPGWSAYIDYCIGDFLTSREAMVVFITASASMSSKLAATVEWDVQAEQTIFNQRKKVGPVAVMPRVTSVTPNYIFYPIAKTSDHMRMMENDLANCIFELRKEAERLGVDRLAFPCVDEVRDELPWAQAYYYLDLTLRGSGIIAKVYDHYYLSYPRYAK